MSATVGMALVVSLFLAVAISYDHASHRLANVENHPCHTGSSEQNRKHQCEEPFWHRYRNNTTNPPYKQLTD
jgi:hypothetical protein